MYTAELNLMFCEKILINRKILQFKCNIALPHCSVSMTCWACVFSFTGTTANPSTPTVRVATPGATILKSTPGAIQQTIGGKQIITVHKASTGGTSSSGQPQIVTLVKTNQGMQVATVSDHKLVPSGKFSLLLRIFCLISLLCVSLDKMI